MVPAIQRGNPVIVVKFANSVCGPCPVRQQCTTSAIGRRQLTLHPKAQTEALGPAAPNRATTTGRTTTPCGIEGTIRQAVAITGACRARYRGITKTRLQHIYSATALNLIRLHA